jgi:hypothetical protein
VSGTWLTEEDHPEVAAWGSQGEVRLVQGH